MPDQGCTHIGAIATIKQPQRYECDECVKIGSDWVHLRTCQECGRTHCCDNSPNRHATRHAQAPGIRSSHRRSRESAGCIAIRTKPPLSTDNTMGRVAGSSVPESTRYAAELR